MDFFLNIGLKEGDDCPLRPPLGYAPVTVEAGNIWGKLFLSRTLFILEKLGQWVAPLDIYLL